MIIYIYVHHTVCLCNTSHGTTVNMLTWNYCIKDGVAECFRKECNCSADDVDLECCQHCDASATCYHADTNAVYNNAERWQFECDTCECLVWRIFTSYTCNIYVSMSCDIFYVLWNRKWHNSSVVSQTF